MIRIKILVISFVVLFFGTALTAGYFYWQWNLLKHNPTVVTQNENKTLIEDVGKLILLPDEQPTIATVTDPSKLTDQAFFANAKVGYKVLVFSGAKKAILYDPTTNKIIEVGPVNVTDDSAGKSNGGTTVEQPTKK